jgi:transcriptional regulator with XRE-family HTH domain
VATDFRLARISAGLSQRFVAAAVGSHHDRIGRFERGEIRDVTTDFLGAICQVVGLDLAIRTYPAGDPIRDAAHTRLLERLRRELPAGARWRTEVPLPIPGDLRAWDAEIELGGRAVKVEAETRITDGQALERRVSLKIRDGRAERVVLLVADTTANRLALAVLRTQLVDLFPLGSRDVLRALRAGHQPLANGIVLL